jgi:hypothetical protein
MKVTNTKKPTLVFSTKSKVNYKQYLFSQKFWTPANSLFISGCVLVFLGSIGATFSGLFISSSSLLLIFQNKSSTSHPTSIPWLVNKSDCEHTGRSWSGGKCWDNEHNPMF